MLGFLNRKIKIKNKNKNKRKNKTEKKHQIRKKPSVQKTDDGARGSGIEKQAEKVLENGRGVRAQKKAYEESS